MRRSLRHRLRRIRERPSNMGPRMSRELRITTQLRTSRVQEKATMLQRTMNLRLPLKRMTQPIRRRPVRGSSGLRTRRKGMKGQAAARKTPTNPAAPAAGAAAGAGAASSVPDAGHQNAQANAGAKAKKPDPQKVEQIKQQHASFRAQPDRTGFRQSRSLRTIESMEAIGGRGRSTKCIAPTIRNVTIRVGITRTTSGWS